MIGKFILRKDKKSNEYGEYCVYLQYSTMGVSVKKTMDIWLNPDHWLGDDGRTNKYIMTGRGGHPKGDLLNKRLVNIKKEYDKVIDDCTDERRSEILFLNSDTAGESEDSTDKRDSQRGAIGIYPELKGMFDSKNQYQNGGTTGISKLLRLFDCEDIKVDRKNGLTLLIHNPFCNILGDLQTGMLRQTFGSEVFMTNGLNQRFLFCIAENIEYPKRSHEKLPNEIYWQWKQTVNMLYENIYHSPNGEHLTLFRCTDGIVTLSESANRLYDDYYNSLQLKKEASQSDYESAIYSKLQIQVIRLAGIVHALQVAEEKGQRQDYTSLNESAMEYAIRCMDYFEVMALKVYEKLIEQPEPKRGSGVTTNQEAIHQLLTRYPNTKRQKLAELLGVSVQYISKAAKS